MTRKKHVPGSEQESPSEARVGQIVWYYPSASSEGQADPEAAVVTECLDDGTVQLTIFPRGDFPLPLGTAVPFVSGKHDTEGAYCTAIPNG